MPFYPAIHSIGQDTKFMVPFFFFHVWLWISQPLAIGVKFYMAVQLHLRQVFSYFGVIAPGMAKFWASTGAIWWDMLLAEALVNS